VCAGVLVPRRSLDARLVGLVRETLLAPEAMIALQGELSRVLEERRRARAGMKAAAAARLATLEREIRHLVDAVATSGLSPALRERLQAAEAELQATRQAERPIEAPAPIVGLPARFKRLLADLQGVFERQIPGEARGMLQELLGEVRLVPEGEAVYAEMESRPERLLAAGGSYLGVVAGTRFGTRLRIRVR
jgi:hypothetical protein